MNENFTSDNKYNTASNSVQQQNVNFDISGCTNSQTQLQPQSQPAQPMQNNAQQNVQYGQVQYQQQSRPVQSVQNNAQQNVHYGQVQYQQQSRPVQPMQNNNAQQNVQYGQVQYQQQGRPVQPMQNNNAQQNVQYGQVQYGRAQYQPPMRNYPVPPYPQYGQPVNAYQSWYVPPTPQEEEKARVKKTSAKAGSTTIVILITMYGVGILVMLIAMFTGVMNIFDVSSSDPYMGFTPVGFYLYEGMTSLLSVFIPSFIIIKMSKLSIEELMPFKPIKGKKLGTIVMSGMAICMLAQIVPSLLGINLGIFGIDIFGSLDSESASGVFDIIMSTVCTAVIPALVEEFAYRGLVAGIMEKHGKLFAVVTSAFLFGMLHGNFVQIPFAFIVGLVLGYVRVKTESMLPCILIHFGNNFFAVLMTAVSDICPDTLGTVIESGVMILLIVAGVASIAYLAKSDKEFFEIKEESSLLSFKEKIKTFFSTGTVVGATVALGVMSLMLVKFM